MPYVRTSQRGRNALLLRPNALIRTPSFNCLMPQQGAARAEGKRKKEVPKGEQKLSLRTSTDMTWSKGTENGTN